MTATLELGGRGCSEDLYGAHRSNSNCWPHEWIAGHRRPEISFDELPNLPAVDCPMFCTSEELV
jgi:hypothetical protein